MGVGLVLNDRYEMFAELGRGGTSIVYLAKDLKLGGCVAVKCIQHRRNEDFDNTLQNEIATLSDLDHPNIPKIISHMYTDTHLYLVMEYINGESLDRKIEVEGPQKEFNLIRWGISLCEILHYLHTAKEYPIIYCDMKPQNIILVNQEPKLIDYGIAKVCDQSICTSKAIGTAGYAAPEQYFPDNKKISPATDIYSMGATFYKAATGVTLKPKRNHFQPIHSIATGISVEFEAIIEKCLDMDPDKRYKSALELKRAFENLKEIKVQKTVKRSKQIVLIAASLCLSVFFGMISIVGYMGMHQTLNQTTKTTEAPGEVTVETF